MKTPFSKFYLVFMLLSALAAASSTFATVPDTFKQDLSGAWQIRLGDDMAWSKERVVLDESWEEIVLPGNVAPYVQEKTHACSGMVWLRKTIFIPKDLEGVNMGLSLGQIAQVDETFFNGKKLGGVGSFPPNETGSWHRPRFYFISHKKINPGAENVITVRVWFHTYGNVSGDLYLADENTWRSDKSWNYFSRIIVNYIIIAAGVPLWFIFILFYFQRPESKEYLLYSAQLFTGLFIILDLCTLWRYPGGIVTQYKLMAYSWIALNVAYPAFLHRLYHFERPKVEAFLCVYLLGSLPFFFWVKESQFRFFGMLVAVLSGAIGFYNVSIHINALWQKKPYARLFGFFGLAVTVGAMHDGFIYMSKLLYFDISDWGAFFNYMLFPISAAALYTGTAIVLVYRFIDLLKTNETLNTKLENKVTERTRSLIHLTEELEKKNITLKDLAIRDSLTGLYNHAAFCDRLDEIFMTAQKNQTPMAVAMIDVDNFKGFNDSYGHQVGDEVLIKIAHVLRAGVREYDFLEKFQHDPKSDDRNCDLAGRYGGDEFIVVLPRCDQPSADKIIKRICNEINEIRIDIHPDVRISGSFGVACFDPRTPCRSSDKLIALADLALYRSKSMGKNQVFSQVYEGT